MDEARLTLREIQKAIEAAPFGSYDLVVAIAEGGITPAALVAKRLGLSMDAVKVRFRGHDNKPICDMPVVEYAPRVSGLRILLVDDVAKSGATLEAAKAALAGNLVSTCVVNGRADISLFQIQGCIDWPWGKTSARKKSCQTGKSD